MKILLIAPLIEPAPMNFRFAMDLVGRSFSHLPLNLATLAALTPRDVEVSIVDENVEPVDLDAEADVVALTGIYMQRRRLFELAESFRKRGRIVAIGGSIATDLEEECRARADAVFVGEAEYTWPRFVRDARAGAVSPVYRQSELVDMNDSPIPRLDLLKNERYAGGCVQATRGCPYRCEYCDVPSKDGGRPRSKPVAQVLEEIRQHVRFGYNSIFFVDDHFAGNRDYVRGLLKAIIELLPTLPGPMQFYTQVTLNVARDPELLELFHAAGFRRFFIGIETPSRESLRSINKNHNIEMDMAEAISVIQSHNITIWAGILLGLDTDDEGSFGRQIRFIEETAITPTLIGLLQVVPGAPLYERVKAEGRIKALPDVVGSGAFGAPSSQGLTNLIPKNMSEQALMQGFARVARAVYAPRAFGDRLIRGLAKGRRRHPSTLKALHPHNIAVLLRTSFFYLAQADPESRGMFLRVMRAVVARRFQGLEEFIFHIVIYKHLRQFYFDAASTAEAAA
jgi:radical SAM superfamily enzyme YgiQ (UPF0313 family)